MDIEDIFAKDPLPAVYYLFLSVSTCRQTLPTSEAEDWNRRIEQGRVIEAEGRDEADMRSVQGCPSAINKTANKLQFNCIHGTSDTKSKDWSLNCLHLSTHIWSDLQSSGIVLN